MIRKLVLSLGAIAIIGATAFAPTAASAKGKNWHGGPRLGIVVANPVIYDDCYLVEKTFWKHGRFHTRVVEVCG